MWGFLHRLRLRAWRQRIERALALTNRGAVSRDHLRLKSVWNRLEIQWVARDLHPWDCDAPAELRAHLFVNQCLADTEEAIHTLFATLPPVDVLEVKVLSPDSGAVLLAGTVHRNGLAEGRTLTSVRMRLEVLGVCAGTFMR